MTGACSTENPFFGVRETAETSEATSASGSTSPADTTGAPPTPTTGADTSGGPSSSGEGSTAADSSSSGGALSSSTTGETAASSTSTSTSSGEMDGSGGSSTGLEAVCGDGVQDEGELCDDGNDAPADACEWNCRPMFELKTATIAAHPRQIAAGDLDGDQNIDLVISHANEGEEGPDLSFGRSLGDGEFAWTTLDDKTMNGAGLLLLGRFAGDAKLDVIAIPADGASTPRLWINVSMAAKISFTVALPVPGPPAISYAAAVAGDLNKDSKDDLLFLQKGAQKLYVQRNTGGAFAAANVYTMQLPQPVGLAVGPLLDGDDVADVLLVHADPVTDLTFMKGNGDPNGTLKPLADALKLCPAGAASISAGDADGGGTLDAAIACHDAKAIVIGQDGENDYMLPMGGALPQLLGAGIIDLYGDDEQADMFAVAAGSSSLYIGVFSGAKFLAPDEVQLAWALGASLAADVTADGAPDIVVLHPGDARVSVLINQTRMALP